jgi:hypothetical protein
MVGDKLTEIEEKYDLTKGTEGYGVIGASGEAIAEEKEEGEEGEAEGEGEEESSEEAGADD